MTGRKLVLTVHVPDEGGDHHVFRAGTVPPAWAQEAITNPHAWADDVDENVVEDGDHDTDPASAGGGDAGASAGASGANAGDGAVSQPPRVGKGSGRVEWLAYAEYRGLAFTEDASRDDIMAVVDQLDA
jgi:hypothetical protein